MNALKKSYLPRKSLNFGIPNTEALSPYERTSIADHLAYSPVGQHYRRLSEEVSAS